jgi:hypothetical protein
MARRIQISKRRVFALFFSFEVDGNMLMFELVFFFFEIFNPPKSKMGKSAAVALGLALPL